MQPRGRQNHFAIWSLSIGLAAITVSFAYRSLHRLDSLGFPAESVAIIHRHPIALLSAEGAVLACVIAFILYRRRAFERLPPPVPSQHRDADGHAYVPLAWITRGRIAFGDAFFDDEGLYLVSYGDESAAEAAASKMGKSGNAMMGGAALRARHVERARVIDGARRALQGKSLPERVLSSVGSARFTRDEIMSFTYGKWLGSKLLTGRGLIIVQDVTPDDAAALQQWIAARAL